MDTSDLMKLLSDKMGGDTSKLDSIFSLIQGSDNASNNADHNDSSNSNASNEGTMPEMPDIETIMKIKKVMDSMKLSSNDPSINLLSSLKPYLRDEKKSKVDQYIKILNMGKAMSMLDDLGGDSK